MVFLHQTTLSYISGTPLNAADVVNGVTTIKSVQRSDDGQYQCTANNFLGNTNASFNLIVHGKIFLNPLLSIFFLYPIFFFFFFGSMQLFNQTKSFDHLILPQECIDFHAQNVHRYLK